MYKRSSKRYLEINPGHFARGSFRPGSFRPLVRFTDGSNRPYYVSRFARRSFHPWVVSPIVFIEGHTNS